jgi:hypothetical protein
MSLPALICACTGGQHETNNTERHASAEVRHAIDFASKSKCADRGDIFLRRERSIDVPSNGINAIVKNEQYTYSPKLDTCLAYFEVTEFDAGTTYNISDTLTNKRLFFHIIWSDQKQRTLWESQCKSGDGCLSDDEFRKKRAELFDVN